MKSIHLIIASLSFLFSLLTFYYSNSSIEFNSLWLLPFLFGLTSLLFSKTINNCKNNLIYAIIVGGYFIRNVISIYLFAESNFQSNIKPSLESSVLYAVLLMAFEVVVVSAFLQSKIEINKKYENQLQPSPSITIKMKFVLIFIIGTMIFMWFKVPEISGNYLSIVDENMSSFSTIENNEQVLRGGVERLMLASFLMLFSILRIIIPVVIFSTIKRTIGNNLFAVGLCLFMISLQFLFITSQTMAAMLVVGIQIWVLMKLFPNSKTIVTLIGGCALLLITFLIVDGKSGDDDLLLASMLQAYFPGVSCVASTFEMPEFPTLLCFLQDLYTCIPFRNSIFPYEFGLKTVEVFNAANNVRGQIIPFISEMYLYVGAIAPFLMLLITKFALYYYKKAEYSNSALHYTSYVYTASFLAMSLSMYHITIVGATFLGTCIPLLYITSLFEKTKEL